MMEWMASKAYSKGCVGMQFCPVAIGTQATCSSTSNKHEIEPFPLPSRFWLRDVSYVSLNTSLCLPLHLAGRVDYDLPR